MKKILVIFSLFMLVGCRDNLYLNIEPSIEEINTLEQYFELIDLALEYEFEYFHFIDLRSSSEYEDLRISHFKNNIDYSKSNNEELLLKQVSSYKTNSFIILISNTGDNLSSSALELLKNNGYTNIKDIAIGIQNFEELLIEQNLENKYLNQGSCGC